MTETNTRPGQRMILRRVSAEESTFGQIKKELEDAEAISVLQENAPSTFLVEGPPSTIAGVVRPHAGWSVTPVTKYPVPDPRPRVLRPASE